MTSCMCSHVTKIKTNTKFIILIHPMELKKVKNNTGRLTYLSLPNSEFIMGVDFSNDRRVNELICTHNCYILYPGEGSLLLNKESLPKKKKPNLIFIIDATWPCSKKMLKLSSNLQILPKVSFHTQKQSIYQIKKQPKDYCLSTIESTKVVLEQLNGKTEFINQEDLDKFLNPFTEMINYQIKCINDPNLSRYERDNKK